MALGGAACSGARDLVGGPAIAPQNVRARYGRLQSCCEDWAAQENSSSSSNRSPETRITAGGSSCRNTCIWEPPSVVTSHPYLSATNTAGLYDQTPMLCRQMDVFEEGINIWLSQDMSYKHFAIMKVAAMPAGEQSNLGPTHPVHHKLDSCCKDRRNLPSPDACKNWCSLTSSPVILANFWPIHNPSKSSLTSTETWISFLMVRISCVNDLKLHSRTHHQEAKAKSRVLWCLHKLIHCKGGIILEEGNSKNSIKDPKLV